MPSNIKQLCIVTLNKPADNAERGIAWSNFTMPTHLQEDIWMYLLAFDGHSTIFALAYHINDVLLWSVNGTFIGQLQLGLLFTSLPSAAYSLTVNSANRTMYVGIATDSRVEVSVFKLTYELT